MKDNRFIELLNLYIDRQISAVETTELEAEIQLHPKRQAIYRQYCQIHCASKRVYDSFRTSAVDQSTFPVERTGTIELFETKRRHNNFKFAISAAVAAACLTFVLVRQNSGPTGNEVLAKTAGKGQPGTITLASTNLGLTEAAGSLLKELPSNPVSLRNSTIIAPDYAIILAAMREQDEERAFANGRLQAGATQSLFDDGVFDSQRNVQPQNPRVYHGRQSPAQQTEFTAFQFQR